VDSVLQERKRKAESGSGTGEIAGIARLGLDFRSGIGVRWLWIDTEDFPFYLRVSRKSKSGYIWMLVTVKENR
jgi:hypothetical protein